MLCFLVSWVGCFLIIKKGPRDIPNERSSHSSPIARGGGLGIVLGFGAGLSFISFTGMPFWEMHALWWTFLISCFLMSVPGFLDDFWSLSATTRLVMQFFVASLFIGLGGHVDTVPLPLLGDVPLGFLAVPLSLFWLVGLVNAFNFLDGLNGLVSGMSLMASFFLGLIAWHHRDFFLLEMSCFFAFACLGFFILNFPKPHVFLGDGGAYFLGAFWGGLTLVYPYSPSSTLCVWTVPLLFFMPLCDVALTLIRRLWRKRPIFTPHREYHMQLLHQVGWSHTKVTILYVGFVMLQGFLAYLAQDVAPSRQALFFLPLLALALWFFPWVIHKARARGVHV
jgi:UDP-GlcNAc:undecaprenyl-phosphate/decaprenyl-phosphate GlcNAc-1-phosphate transferase